jgi:hypothetical protein
MLQRPLLFLAVGVATLLCGGCVAKSESLQKQAEAEGLDPALLSAVASRKHQPVADNETADGRAKNRLIAVILLPKEER